MARYCRPMPKKIPIAPLVCLSFLIVPWLAMQASDQVDWSLFDFVVMGGLLLFVGLGVELVFKRHPGLKKRLAYTALIVLLFLVVWAELAVGLFGD